MCGTALARRWGSGMAPVPHWPSGPHGWRPHGRAGFDPPPGHENTHRPLKGTDMSRYVLRDFDMSDELIIDPDSTPVSRIKAFFTRTLGCPGAHAERMAWRAVDAITAPGPPCHAL